MNKDNPLKLGHHGKKAQVVWHAGTIQPYSSLWITVLRFLVLNQPTPMAFMQDFSADPSRQTLSKFSLDSNGTGSAQCPLRLLRLARVLREPIERFKGSYIGQYPQSTWPLFRKSSSCPVCLQEGFHSVLFSLDGLFKCPIHHERLNNFVCCQDQRISHSLNSSDFSSPGMCKCGSRFLDFRSARTPTVNLDRNQALEDVTQWLNSIGSRCWLGLHNTFTSTSQIDKFIQHLAKLKEPLRLPESVAWWPPKQDLTLTAPFTVELLKYGGATKQSDHSRTSDLNSKVYFKHIAQSPYQYQDVANTDFKSIKRYLLKHVARNGRQWITKFAAASDVDSIFNMLVDGGSEARMAWSVVLWWQSSVWNLSLRNWFKKSEFRNVSIDEIPFFTSQYEDKRRYSLRSAVSEEWMARWLNAMSLISLWQAATVDASQVKSPTQVMWGRGVLGGRVIPEWSAGLDDEKHLVLCIKRQAGPSWIVAQRQNKKDRQACFHAQLRKRFNRVLTACIPDCFWYHSANSEWGSGPGPIPKELRDGKRHRLLPSKSKTEFVVFPYAMANDTRRVFVARSLSLPVAATGSTPRDAVGGLKFAMEHYTTRQVKTGLC